MSDTGTVRVMLPEEIATLGSSQVPHLRLPERRSCFAEREMRLRQMARQHAMGDFLLFMAEVAHAQQQALAAMPAVPLPTLDALSQATQQGRPALDIETWPRDAAWQQALRQIAQAVLPKAPEATRPVLQALIDAPAEALERQAEALLVFPHSSLDLAQAPLIGAALQTYWVHLVSGVQASHPDRHADALFGRTDDASTCPCCGSLPVASITRNVGGAMAQRYLRCGLCDSEWHMQRAQCSHCLTRGQLAYQSLDLATADGEPDGQRAARAPVQAEECEHCHHYLKIMHTDRDPFVDPVADDLATLPLDLLMSEAGRQRHGQNLALIFHQGSDDPSAAAALPDGPDPGRRKGAH